MPLETKKRRFERLVMPYINSAYNLARWLTSNDDDARDLVQETYLRAYKFFDAFHGETGRAWLLTIVRNTHYTTYNRTKHFANCEQFDDELHGAAFGCAGNDHADPLHILQQRDDCALVQRAIEALPAEFREVIVLREIEDLSYKQIAVIVDAPIGTVMSRLARARAGVQKHLLERRGKEVGP